MEVLASKNRMSATASLSIYFGIRMALEMAPDCLSNLTGLAEIYIDDQWIMYCIFIFFLTLFVIPICVQLNILWKCTVFHKHLYFLHGIFQDTFLGILGIYNFVWQCRKIPVIQEKTTQQNWQVLPPTDEFITIPDLSTLTLQQKPSLKPTEEKPQTIPVPEQDRAQTQVDPQRDYRQVITAFYTF